MSSREGGLIEHMQQDPLPGHLLLLAMVACLGLTFSLVYRLRPKSDWYFEQRPGPMQIHDSQQPILMMNSQT